MIPKTARVTLTQANAAIQQLLVGAYLDSFNVSSVSVSLRFINSVLKNGVNLCVDSYFTCPAEVVGSRCEVSEAAAEDFFIGRSRFIGEICKCIGKAIEGLNVEAGGGLVLEIEGALVKLHVSSDDWENDDSVWSISMDGSDAHHASVSSVSCIAQDSIFFVADFRG